MNATARITLRLVPDSLKTQPVFLCIDDTMVPKSGTKFADVSKLFDHAAHNCELCKKVTLNAIMDSKMS